MSEPTSLDNKIKADLEALKRERLNDCAPEMYEALKNAEENPLDFDLKRVRAILAKCRGET